MAQVSKFQWFQNVYCPDDAVVDAAVSFDGTWAKRGFTSLTGVVFVLSVDTGAVLDYHVPSKSCQKCRLKKGRRNSDDKFEEWQIEHIASGKCDINFHGSSPSWTQRKLKFYGTDHKRDTKSGING